MQIVARDDDRAANQSVAREHSRLYLGLQNYVNNLKETGFPDLRVGDDPGDELWKRSSRSMASTRASDGSANTSQPAPITWRSCRCRLHTTRSRYLRNSPRNCSPSICVSVRRSYPV